MLRAADDVRPGRRPPRHRRVPRPRAHVGLRARREGAAPLRAGAADVTSAVRRPGGGDPRPRRRAVGGRYASPAGRPPMRWERTVTVIGCHVGGEDNHVIVGGVLPPPGATMFDKKRHLETHGDELRRWLLLEPRGKPTLCMNLVVPPTRPDCDVGLIIMEATDYPPMSGSNTICTVTVLLETGMLPMREPVTRLTLDTPAGPVPVEARCRAGKVERVQFTNVPCFATHLGATLDVEGLGRIAVDIAYGGAFFAIVDAPSLGFSVEPKEARDLVTLGNRIVAAAKQQLAVR